MIQKIVCARSFFLVIILLIPIRQLAMLLPIALQKGLILSTYATKAYFGVQKNKGLKKLLPKRMRLKDRHTKKTKKDIEKAKADLHVAFMDALGPKQKEFVLALDEFIKKYSDNPHQARKNMNKLMMAPINLKNFPNRLW